MAKRKKSGGGFSTQKIKAPATSTTNNDQSKKEQKALALIQEGNLHEAEMIYRELVRGNSENCIVYGNLGVLLEMKGDSKNAVIYFSKAIKINPDYPQAHYNLGLIHKKSGHLDSAIRCYKKALHLQPEYTEAYNNLGNAYKKKHDLDAAIDCYKKALDIKPNYAEAHNNLGNSYKEKGDLDAAIDCYEKALDLNSDYAEAHNNLGLLLQDKAEFDLATNCYKKALDLKPNFAEAHNNLGLLLQNKGDFSLAIDCYKKALDLKPDYAEAHNNLGSAFQALDELDEALVNYQASLAIDQENSKSFYGLGTIQAIKGNLKHSKRSFHKALKIDPRNCAALYSLTKNIQDDEEMLELSIKLESIDRTGLSKKNILLLEAALANVNHRSKDYEKATKHLAEANKIKLFYNPSDLNEHLLRTGQTIAMTQQIDFGNPTGGDGRIFIIGAPRSGSTLLESVLATNSNIRALGETIALSRAFFEIQNRIIAKEKSISLSTAYTTHIDEALTRFTHSVDKNLYNFRFTGAIALGMPSAKIIHCRRHPLDNILSMLRSNLRPGHSYTADPLDAAKFIIDQEKVMTAFKNKYNDKIFVFDYDKFVGDPQKNLPQLIDWLGLKWNEEYLHPERSNRNIRTASVIQARLPISNKSVGGWKNYREFLKPAEDALRASGIFEL